MDTNRIIQKIAQLEAGQAELRRDLGRIPSRTPVVSGSSRFVTADNKTALDAKMTNNQIGFTTGTFKRAYTKVDDELMCFTHIEVP